MAHWPVRAAHEGSQAEATEAQRLMKLANGAVSNLPGREARAFASQTRRAWLRLRRQIRLATQYGTPDCCRGAGTAATELPAASLNSGSAWGKEGEEGEEGERGARRGRMERADRMPGMRACRGGDRDGKAAILGKTASGKRRW